MQRDEALRELRLTISNIIKNDFRDHKYKGLRWPELLPRNGFTPWEKYHFALDVLCENEKDITEKAVNVDVMPFFKGAKEERAQFVATSFSEPGDAGISAEQKSYLHLWDVESNGFVPAPRDYDDLLGTFEVLGNKYREEPPPREARIAAATPPDPAPTVEEAPTRKAPGRKRINEQWEAAAFAAELGLIKELEAKDYDSNQIVVAEIFSALPVGTVSSVNDVKRMRDRHKKRAPKEATCMADSYLSKNGLKLGKSKEISARIAKHLVEENAWRAYLEGGHKGDWAFLERILNKELAQQRRNLVSEK